MVQDVLLGSVRVAVMMHVFIELVVGVMEVVTLQSIRVVFHERVLKWNYMWRRLFFIHFEKKLHKFVQVWYILQLRIKSLSTDDST